MAGHDTYTQVEAVGEAIVPSAYITRHGLLDAVERGNVETVQERVGNRPDRGERLCRNRPHCSRVGIAVMLYDYSAFLAHLDTRIDDTRYAKR